MKSYTELAEEALRQRDAYIINRKKTIKKAVLSVSLVLVFAVFGGGAFIGISHLNSPDVPPALTAESSATDAPTESVTEPLTTVADSHTEPAEITDTAEDTSDPAESSESDPTEQPTEEYTAPPPDTYPTVDTYAPLETETPAEVITAEPQTEPQHTETGPAATEADTDAPNTDEPEETDVNTGEDNNTNTGIPPATDNTATDNNDEPIRSPAELWETDSRPNIGVPTFWGEVPDVLVPPISNAPGDTTTPSAYIEIPSKVYYSTEFDYPDFFFLNDDSPTVLPKYGVDKVNSPTAKEQTDRFLELLYGESLPFMGEYEYTEDEVVYFTWDDAIVESRVGKFIAADSDRGRIYFTIDLANPETVGGGYRDMTRTEAFEYLSQSEYYKAATELLGLREPMVMTEIHRYYSGNLYEYRFTVMESADNIETALYNFASANAEIEMRYYPDYGVIRVYFEINYPVTLKNSGGREFYSYSQYM